MSIVNVGTRSLLLTQSLVGMRAQLGDLQRQLATGKRADDYASIGIDRGLTVGLRSHLSTVEGYGDTITSVGVRLDLAQTALTRIAEIGRETKAVAADMSSSNGRATAQTTAEAALGEILGLLNTRVGDRYMFSGLSNDQPAVQSLSTDSRWRRRPRGPEADRCRTPAGGSRRERTGSIGGVIAVADRGRGQRRDAGNGFRFQARSDLIVACRRDGCRSGRCAAAGFGRPRRRQSERR